MQRWTTISARPSSYAAVDVVVVATRLRPKPQRGFDLCGNAPNDGRCLSASGSMPGYTHSIASMIRTSPTSQPSPAPPPSPPFPVVISPPCYPFVYYKRTRISTSMRHTTQLYVVCDETPRHHSVTTARIIAHTFQCSTQVRTFAFGSSLDTEGACVCICV